jgi:hypothetical protein
MKKRILLITALCFLLFDLCQGQHRSLSYVQSSTGLGNPEMDGGRTELEFADVNGDGHIDLLSIGDHGNPYINTQQHGIMVWFGDGNGNWEVYQNGDFGYGGIAVGDVNNDGHLDVGYGMHHNYSGEDLGDQLIEVALGDGTGMNWTPWDDGLATNGESWGMFGTDFGDIDNDGDLDLGSTSFGSGAGVHLYRNNSDGTWTQTFGYLGGNSSMLFDFGDINNDGLLDFAVSHENGTVYFGNGSGLFTVMDVNLPSGGGMGHRGTSLGDMNNDGADDLAFINSSGGIEIWSWFEDITEWVDYSGTLPSSGDYEATQLYDMNLDGFIDLAAFGEGTFTLWLGDGQGNWTEETGFTTPPYGYFQAFRVGGDVDHNGYPDMAIVAEEGSGWVYQNHLYCYKESSVAEELSIFPVFPRGHENIYPYSVRSIEWLSAVPDNAESYVRLDYSEEGPEGPWNLIADSLPNNGHFQWSVPFPSVWAYEDYIRYTVMTPSDSVEAITPQAFTIFFLEGIDKKQPETLQFILSPNPFREEVDLLCRTTLVGSLIFDICNSTGTLICSIPITGENGIYRGKWDGRNGIGTKMPAGLYLGILRVDGMQVAVKKLVKQ